MIVSRDKSWHLLWEMPQPGLPGAPGPATGGCGLKWSQHSCRDWGKAEPLTAQQCPGQGGDKRDKLPGVRAAPAVAPRGHTAGCGTDPAPLGGRAGLQLPGLFSRGTGTPGIRVFICQISLLPSTGKKCPRSCCPV